MALDYQILELLKSFRRILDGDRKVVATNRVNEQGREKWEISVVDKDVSL